MNRPRFSLRMLLLAVAFVAVGFTALLFASALWASVLFNVTLLTLTVSVVLAKVRGGALGAFWFGFAAFGWIYFILVNWPGSTTFRDRLPTHAALRVLYNTLPDSRTRLPKNWSSGPYDVSDFELRFDPTNKTRQWVGFDSTGVVYYYPPSTAAFGYGIPANITQPVHFKPVGHALWTLILAVLGGVFARWVYSPGENGQDRSPQASEA